MKTLNSIAIEYLLRNDSQRNNDISEQIAREVTRLHQEQEAKRQKSLLFQMYELEEEADELFA